MLDEHPAGATPASLAGSSTAVGLDGDSAFDRRAFRAILLKAFAERSSAREGGLARRLGLGGEALRALLARFAPDAPPLKEHDLAPADECEEQAWVRGLLLRNRSLGDETSAWLASITARRALEANHLWEDMGLWERPALTCLLLRHFAPLASRNTNNMRWKRFFYRMLCEEEGLAHCTSPTCRDCPDVTLCFEPDSAEAMIAKAKRAPGPG